MSEILRVVWTVTPTAAPQPQLHCRRCGTVTNFASSGKIRVNGNGKKLDAWLIYKCVVCDNTWNRPVLERQTVGALDPELFRALSRNDTALADRIAFDVADLRRRASRVEEFDGISVKKAVSVLGESMPEKLEIALSVPCPVALRLDRFLAAELGLPRSRIQALVASGGLRIDPALSRVLKKPVRDGTVITLSGTVVDVARVTCQMR